MPLLGQRSARETAASGGAVICDQAWRQRLVVAFCWGKPPGLTAHRWSTPAEDDLEQLSGVRSRLAPSLVRAPMDPCVCSSSRLPTAATNNLLGPLPGCSNLSLFTGFGGPFALVPTVTPLMAQALVTNDWSQIKGLGLLCR